MELTNVKFANYLFTLSVVKLEAREDTELLLFAMGVAKRIDKNI